MSTSHMYYNAAIKKIKSHKYEKAFPKVAG